MSELEDLKKELYAKALRIWGRTPQFLVAIEECGELSAALSRSLTGKGSQEELLSELITELADVKIMTDQLTVMIDQEQGEGTVDKEIHKKLLKLKGYLDKH